MSRRRWSIQVTAALPTVRCNAGNCSGDTWSRRSAEAGVPAWSRLDMRRAVPRLRETASLSSWACTAMALSPASTVTLLRISRAAGRGHVRANTYRGRSPAFTGNRRSQLYVDTSAPRSPGPSRVEHGALCAIPERSTALRWWQSVTRLYCYRSCRRGPRASLVVATDSVTVLSLSTGKFSRIIQQHRDIAAVSARGSGRYRPYP